MAALQAVLDTFEGRGKISSYLADLSAMESYDLRLPFSRNDRL